MAGRKKPYNGPDRRKHQEHQIDLKDPKWHSKLVSETGRSIYTDPDAYRIFDGKEARRRHFVPLRGQEPKGRSPSGHTTVPNVGPPISKDPYTGALRNIPSYSNLKEFEKFSDDIFHDERRPRKKIRKTK